MARRRCDGPLCLHLQNHGRDLFTSTACRLYKSQASMLVCLPRIAQWDLLFTPTGYYPHTSPGFLADVECYTGSVMMHTGQYTADDDCHSLRLGLPLNKIHLACQLLCSSRLGFSCAGSLLWGLLSLCLRLRLAAQHLLVTRFKL